MENAQEVLLFLEDFSKRKPKTIPQELNEYVAYVARTGDPVYQWTLVKNLYKEKLINVMTDFYETTSNSDIPPYPNVDPFNYDIMKNSLLERFDSFTAAPFTVQRISELLTFPRKQYNRVDKFMRAIEKTILVVSTREPGMQRHPEENGEANEPVVNGSDNNSEYNVDVEMEDMSWKDNNTHRQNCEPQPSSSDAHITVDDIEARLKAKEEAPMDIQEKKLTTQYESVTPPELNVTDDSTESALDKSLPQEDAKADTNTDDKSGTPIETESVEDPKVDIEMKTEGPTTLIIPEIKVEDAEMTEQKLLDEAKTEKEAKIETADVANSEPETTDLSKATPESELPQAIDESSSDSKEEPEKLLEVLTSSEESSSSSDNTDGNSNSPKTDEGHIDVQEESDQSDSNPASTTEIKTIEDAPPVEKEEEASPQKIESDNYSISDVNSELKQPQTETKTETVEEKKDIPAAVDSENVVEEKPENLEPSSENKESLS